MEEQAHDSLHIHTCFIGRPKRSAKNSYYEREGYLKGMYVLRWDERKEHRPSTVSITKGDWKAVQPFLTVSHACLVIIMILKMNMSSS